MRSAWNMRMAQIFAKYNIVHYKVVGNHMREHCLEFIKMSDDELRWAISPQTTNQVNFNKISCETF